jgi:hypothetical protein
MFSIEATLKEIFSFIKRFNTTYFFSFFRVNRLLKKLRENEAEDLISSFTFLLITIFIFFSTFNTIFFSNNLLPTPNAFYSNYSNFFSSLNFLEKLLLVAPLIVILEIGCRLLGRMLFVQRAERSLFRAVSRYFISGVLLSICLIFFVFLILEFYIYQIKEKKYFYIFDKFGPVLLLMLLIPFFSLIQVIAKDVVLNKTTKIKYLSLVIYTPAITILTIFAFASFYKYYNLRLNSSKVTVSSIQDLNSVVLNYARDNELDCNGMDTTFNSVPKSYRDSVRQIKSFVLLQNKGSRDYIIDLAKFEPEFTFYNKENNVYDNTDRDTRFYLKYCTLKKGDEPLLILRPHDTKIVELFGLLDFRDIDFIQHHQVDNFRMAVNVYPDYGDFTHHIIEDVQVKLEQ